MAFRILPWNNRMLSICVYQKWPATVHTSVTMTVIPMTGFVRTHCGFARNLLQFQLLENYINSSNFIRHLSCTPVHSGMEKCPFFQPDDPETLVNNAHPALDKNTRPTETPSDVVLVTGGAGFLGQHVVQQLQERTHHVKEIRVLDLKPYKNTLGHTEPTPMTSYVGRVEDWDTVQRAFQGVNSVIHIAGLVSYGTFPDMQGMELTNVHGTKNVIDGCVRSGVERLIYCSTVDVVVGFDNIVYGTETTTSKPNKFLFPGYPDTKFRAEKLVLQANGKQCHYGKQLTTVSLRANVMYGKGDPYYVTNGLKMAAANNGSLIQVGNGRSKFQQAYVGNSAWAFICAENALRSNPKLGGEVFFIPDDTPLRNSFAFMKPFLESRNFHLSKYKLPYLLVYPLLWCVEAILHFISPLVKINMQTASCSVKYINMDLSFNGNKGRQLLQYQPIYSPHESMKRSLQFYKNLKINNQ